MIKRGREQATIKVSQEGTQKGGAPGCQHAKVKVAEEAEEAREQATIKVAKAKAPAREGQGLPGCQHAKVKVAEECASLIRGSGDIGVLRISCNIRGSGEGGAKAARREEQESAEPQGRIIRGSGEVWANGCSIRKGAETSNSSSSSSREAEVGIEGEESAEQQSAEHLERLTAASRQRQEARAGARGATRQPQKDAWF